MATNVYVPGIVPSGDDIQELQRYLNDEMINIARGIRTTTVQSAYGGLAITSPLAADEANITPEPLVGWDTFFPARPVRVITNTDTGVVPDGSVLVTLEAGVFQFSCQVNVGIQSGRTYRLTLRRNDSITPLFGSWDTSNQTDNIWMTFEGMTEAVAGDVFSVWYNSTMDGSTFDVEGGSFQCFRVSELLNLT